MLKRLSLGIFFLVTSQVYGSGALTVGQFQRINTPVDAGVDNNFVQLDFSERREKGRWDFVYDGSLRQYTGDRGLLYSVPEAYISRHIGRSEFTLGRKIIDWQPNDRFWAMGEINSLKNFNLLETDREGSFGFHFQRKTENVSFLIYASAINVPQVNPTFTSKDGKVLGRNEWSNPPPQFARFRGNVVPVYYDVIYPQAQEIALHESLAGRLALHNDNHEWRGYLGYKPETGIRLVATGYYEQAEVERAVVQAKPFINSHTFWGTGYSYSFSGQKDNGLSFHANYDSIIPDRGTDSVFDQFESLKVQPVYERVSYASASLKGQSSFISWSVNGLQLVEGDVIDTNIFAKKPRWRQAIGFDMDWSLTDKVSLFVDYKYDLKTQDMGFLARTNYQMTRHFLLGLDLQVLNAPTDYSFWTPYRSNDSFLGRMTYLF